MLYILDDWVANYSSRGKVWLASVREIEEQNLREY
jgi:hypothetical protein